jgi:glucose-1-phosphate cytidylyltransferase
LRVKEYLGNETFMLTYGDGVADIELKASTSTKATGRLATVTAVRPPSRFEA